MSTTSTEFRNAAIVERLNSDKEEKEGKKKEKRNIPVLFVPRTAIGKKKNAAYCIEHCTFPCAKTMNHTVVEAYVRFNARFETEM